jgi:hypothetical protein
MNRSSFAKGVAALAAGAMALGAVSAAQAQPYGQYGYNSGPGPGYDPCQRDASGRGIGGALIGGGIGAVVGSQVSANHHRSDGSLLGGVVGALIGANVGHSSAACRQGSYAPPPPPPQAAYYNGGGYDNYAYAPPPPPVYQGRYDDDRGFAYGHRGERFRIAQGRVGADGCTLAESPIYLPDGRVQKRFVRVCQDSEGRYQVVD